MAEEVDSPPSQAALLRNLLLYLGRRTRLQSARIQKLVYLVEADYADRTGRRLTDYRFRYDSYGMFSPVLRADVRGVVSGDERFEMTEYPTQDGGKGFLLTISEEAVDGDLPEEVRKSCDQVLKEYGDLNKIADLAAAAKRTLPFVGTKKGGTVDWSVLTDPCSRGDCEDELSGAGQRILQESIDSSK